jgi:atlastin
MSDDEVLVEHPDIENENLLNSAITETSIDDLVEIDKGPWPLQIVSIGTEENQYAFSFHKEELNGIMSKIPPGWKVAIVSVVGAFRTGKSFLLSWFLRYLHFLKESNGTSNSKKWYERYHTLGNDGFHWRGGSDRNTTGIWMWSEPHFLKQESGEEIAVLLVDTQGMFDHETTMSLTTSIFGLSTLLSSYQIYNVDKRIQEDNLQQLALFSEYARMAMSAEGDEGNDCVNSNNKPFQHIEFLVRDWQNFEEEEDCDEMRKEMNVYLEKVIAERDAKDLQETRQHILSCFDKVTCYGLVHPGSAVTKKTFNGDIKSMDPTFLKLLDQYCARVFNIENLAPKKIHGRELTAVEFCSYMQVYADLFADGASFPEAATLLDATANANNHSAVYLGINEYKEIMNRIAGPQCSNYVKAEVLEEDHSIALRQSLEKFKSVANFGNKQQILDAREKLTSQVKESFIIYSKLNEARNPLAGLET